MAIGESSITIQDMLPIAANSLNQGITLNKLQSIRVDMEELTLLTTTCQGIGVA